MTYEEALLKVLAGFGVFFAVYEAIKKIVEIYKAPSKEVKTSLESKIDNLDVRIKHLEEEVCKLEDEEDTLKDIREDIQMVFKIQFALLQHEITGNHLNDMDKLLSELGNYLND